MIKLNRINAIVDHDIPYKVYIDTIAVTEIYNGELKDIHLKPGKHEIELKSNQFKSNKISFDLSDGEILEIEVSPDYHENVFSKLATNILFGKQGIKIKIKNDIFI